MKLSTYLKKSELSQAAFAKLVGVTQGRVSQWLDGESIPAERCLVIEKATKGAVSRFDLRPDLWKAEAA